MSHLIFQLSDFLKITNAEKIFHNFVADCTLILLKKHSLNPFTALHFTRCVPGNKRPHAGVLTVVTISQEIVVRF